MPISHLFILFIRGHYVCSMLNVIVLLLRMRHSCAMSPCPLVERVRILFLQFCIPLMLDFKSGNNSASVKKEEIKREIVRVLPELCQTGCLRVLRCVGRIASNLRKHVRSRQLLEEHAGKGGSSKVEAERLRFTNSVTRSSSARMKQSIYRKRKEK